ncbi:MAG: phosphoribosylglycinamide formyltransferase [Ornithinimicrobium sp.]|uniref:phosphoribosylglycinamide formyltransferase n=1 Tax=Ornithinimicrobium sp. TaxID=1977084 RepID=UPI003D9B414A
MSAALPVVVLVSGAGSNLQALIDAQTTPGYGARIVAVGADRPGTGALARAEAAGIPGFVCAVPDHPDRSAWDDALARHLAAYLPECPRGGLVVSAGFMKILGPTALRCATVLNTHPALLPAFPGAHAVRDALAHGVRVTGCTVHLVDAGVDTGPILAQWAVPVRTGDSEATLHERIKAVERDLLVRTVHRLATRGHTITDRKVTIP